MGIPVSESRPSSFSNWGDDNPTPSTSIVEPTGSLQQTGWTPSQKPPAPYMNWIHWIANRWTKNLDVRAPRIPLYKWFVGEQSGAHFATLAAALASSSVVDGDWIYFSPSTANTTLASAITVSKSVKIMFEPGTEFTGSDTRAFIISANDVELNGAGFDNSWAGASEAVIEITGARARVIKCNFDTGNARYIDADTVADADQPILSHNYPDSLMDRQLLDLWTWEAGKDDVDSIAAATNDLQWLKAFSASATWAGLFPAAAMGNRYWELFWMFSEGISLQIEDGNGDKWLIVPKSNASFETYVTFDGVVGTSDYKLNILATGIGVVYDVFKNGVAAVNFSTFTTLSSGSMDADSFRAVLYGDRAKSSSINGVTTKPALPKRRWIRFVTGNVFTDGIQTTDTVAFRAAFIKGKLYRFTLNLYGDVAATSFMVRFYNHFSTTTGATLVQESLFLTSNGVSRNILGAGVFHALNEDFCFKTSAEIDFNSGNHVTANDLTYMGSEGRFWPQVVIEEL